MPDANGVPTPGEAMHAQGRIPDIPNPPFGSGCLWFIGIWIALGIASLFFFGGHSIPPVAEDQPNEHGPVQAGLLDTWGGKVTRSPGKKSSNIVIVLRQGQSGQLVGTLTHGKCRADLRLISARPRGLTVSEERYGEKKRCIGSGKISLDLHRDHLVFEWSASKASQHGNLKRK